MEEKIKNSVEEWRESIVDKRKRAEFLIQQHKLRYEMNKDKAREVARARYDDNNRLH